MNRRVPVNTLEAELQAATAFRELGLTCSVSEMQRRFQTATSPLEVLKELDVTGVGSQAAYGSLAETLIALWNHTPRDEFGGATPDERHRAGAQVSPQRAGTLAGDLFREALRTFGPPPGDPAQEDDYRRRLQAFQQRWRTNPQVEPGGLPPAQVTGGRRALLSAQDLPLADVAYPGCDVLKGHLERFERTSHLDGIAWAQTWLQCHRQDVERDGVTCSACECATARTDPDVGATCGGSEIEPTAVPARGPAGAAGGRDRDNPHAPYATEPVDRRIGTPPAQLGAVPIADLLEQLDACVDCLPAAEADFLEVARAVADRGPEAVHLHLARLVEIEDPFVVELTLFALGPERLEWIAVELEAAIADSVGDAAALQRLGRAFFSIGAPRWLGSVLAHLAVQEDASDIASNLSIELLDTLQPDFVGETSLALHRLVGSGGQESARMFYPVSDPGAAVRSQAVLGPTIARAHRVLRKALRGPHPLGALTSLARTALALPVALPPPVDREAIADPEAMAGAAGGWPDRVRCAELVLAFMEGIPGGDRPVVQREIDPALRLVGALLGVTLRRRHPGALEVSPSHADSTQLRARVREDAPLTLHELRALIELAPPELHDLSCAPEPFVRKNALMALAPSLSSDQWGQLLDDASYDELFGRAFPDLIRYHRDARVDELARRLASDPREESAQELFLRALARCRTQRAASYLRWYLSGDFQGAAACWLSEAVLEVGDPPLARRFCQALAAGQLDVYDEFHDDGLLTDLAIRLELIIDVYRLGETAEDLLQRAYEVFRLSHSCDEHDTSCMHGEIHEDAGDDWGLAPGATPMAGSEPDWGDLPEPPDFASSAPPRITPLRATPTPGRNDPCPCGSGRKYKKCCGAAQ